MYPVLKLLTNKGGLKGLDLTGMMYKIEKLYVQEMSHIVPLSNQTPIAFCKGVKASNWRLKTSLLIFIY